MRVVPRITTNYPSRHISKDICRDFFARSNEEKERKYEHSKASLLVFGWLYFISFDECRDSHGNEQSEFLWLERSNEEGGENMSIQRQACLSLDGYIFSL